MHHLGINFPHGDRAPERDCRDLPRAAGRDDPRSGLRRSAFARRIGIDRSTLTQLLASENDRLPRAETIAAMAADQQVSVDWLLGLSQEGPLSADLMPQPIEIEVGGDGHLDERCSAGMPRRPATRSAMCRRACRTC